MTERFPECVDEAIVATEAEALLADAKVERVAGFPPAVQITPKKGDPFLVRHESTSPDAWRAVILRGLSTQTQATPDQVAEQLAAQSARPVTPPTEGVDANGSPVVAPAPAAEPAKKRGWLG
jgi:hypothetical protein